MSTKQRKFERKIGWGQALFLEVGYHSPGLKPVVGAIHRAVGPDVGTRNTFAKLYDSDTAPESVKERWRAWLLLTALGQDPAAWQIGDDIIPAAHDLERLRDLVRSWSPWITTCAGQLDLLAAVA